MSKGLHHHTKEDFDEHLTFLLIGANSWCKCMVGNKIIGYEHFLPEHSTLEDERASVSLSDMDTFEYFQQKIGKKMGGNTVVVLVNSNDNTSAGPNNRTHENQEMILSQYGRKLWIFDKHLEQSELIKQLIACRKHAPQLHNDERLSHQPTYVEREISKPQETMTQEQLPGGIKAGVKKKNTLTIVLLGQTGSGKSATGNTILRKQHFESRASYVPVTKMCQLAEESVCGIRIKVIDTPDFFDEDLKNQKEQIRRCKELTQPGLDVYLLVMELGRYTDGERVIVQNIQRAFGAELVKETIILFTSKEKLRGKTLSEYIKNTDTQLQELVRSCGSRCHAFNNNDHNASQVEKLLEMILEMKRKNGYLQTFTNTTRLIRSLRKKTAKSSRHTQTILSLSG